MSSFLRRLSGLTAPIPGKAPFRFMDLPIELRLKIYSYLVPDTTVKTYLISHSELLGPCPCKNLHPALAREDDNPFRNDLEACGVQLLRTNQTIYQELVPIWYGRATFEGHFRFNWLLFASKAFLSFSDLPIGFGFIRKLSLNIDVEHRSLYHAEVLYENCISQARRLETRLNFVKAIAYHFSPSGTGRLEEFNLAIFPDPALFYLRSLPEDIVARKAYLKEILANNLHPLQNIRASKTVKVSRLRKPVLRPQSPRNEIIDAMNDYLEWLEGKISASSIITPRQLAGVLASW